MTFFCYLNVRFLSVWILFILIDFECYFWRTVYSTKKISFRKGKILTFMTSEFGLLIFLKSSVWELIVFLNIYIHDLSDRCSSLQSFQCSSWGRTNHSTVLFANWLESHLLMLWQDLRHFFVTLWFQSCFLFWFINSDSFVFEINSIWSWRSFFIWL